MPWLSTSGWYSSAAITPSPSTGICGCTAWSALGFLPYRPSYACGTHPTASVYTATLRYLTSFPCSTLTSSLAFLSYLLVRRAQLWCWISDSYNSLRIWTYYLPIWACIGFSTVIYIAVGYRVFRQRNILRNLTLSTQAKDAQTKESSEKVRVWQTWVLTNLKFASRCPLSFFHIACFTSFLHPSFKISCSLPYSHVAAIPPSPSL